MSEAPEVNPTPAKTPEAHPLDAVTGGAFSAETSGDRAARLRDWLATSPAHDVLQEVFKEMNARDKGAARVVRERLDELRRLDWRPRQVRQQAHKVRDTLRSLTRQLGRAPRDEEVLRATGLSEAQYQSYLRAEAAEAIESLDALLLEGAREFQQSGSGVEEYVLGERLLAQALAQLDERERLVLTLYYQHELSLKEIGLVLDISDARVCQLSKQAIEKAHHFLTKSNLTCRK